MQLVEFMNDIKPDFLFLTHIIIMRHCLHIGKADSIEI